MSLDFDIEVGLTCFHNVWVAFKAARMDKVTKEETKSVLWRLQHFSDQELWRSRKRRLRMNGGERGPGL